MRFSKIARTLVVSLAAVALMASGSSAVEAPSSAVSDGAQRIAATVGPRNIVAPTALTIWAKRHKATRGDRLAFKGVLTSSAAECWTGQKVRLLRQIIGSGESFTAVGSATTNTRGRYVINTTFKKPAKYRASYGGFSGGVHPNQLTCFASSSATFRVKAA